MSLKLNLGCGDKILPGYVNIDVVDERAKKKPDIQHDITKIHELYDKDSVDEILAVHVIEHFYLWEVHDLLSSWKSILKPGGRIVLEAPDLQKAVYHLINNPGKPQLSMWALYGDPSWKDPLMCHKWAYTPDSLAFILEQVGFKDTHEEPAQFKLKNIRDMRVVGTK